MSKRDRFIAEIKLEAAARGLSFRLGKGRGKGDRFTTPPSREIDPKTARKITKVLGLG